ncbi:MULTISPECIES: 3-isopropylmalate dehydrogenase [unclassified Campylobacter]|uniref:3-isopropylmalate dehydrogenase n=1 Tax=unclassified Campylobacter TaxID=2593542 RepID=UPI0014730D87|nr:MULTISPECIES: 3-isopropylmalate dehydrogenase [unclassified Campylobacter]
MAKIYNIAVIKGDGIGSEIVDEAIKVLDASSVKHGFELNYNFYLMGGAAIDVFGEPLPSETLNGALSSDAVLFGAIGGPKWDNLPTDKRPESGLLKLRKELGAYANLRPAMIFDELVDASTLKPQVLQDVDFIVVRELTGGIYFGQPREKKDDSAFNTMAYSKFEIERIAKVAFDSAMLRKKQVCLVDKANVLETSQLWREVVNEVAQNYPEVKVDFMYVDNAAMQIVRSPRQFDVILTENLFGDILSDEASMVCGSIGLLPSASIGGKVGIYEPIHGSAPDIAGQGIANPIATILSAAMLLRYSLGEKEAANSIENAVKMALAEGYRTKDIADFGAKEICTTSEMGGIIAKFIGKQ